MLLVLLLVMLTSCTAIPQSTFYFFFILIIKYLTYATKINNNEGVLDLECVAYCVDKY